MTRKNYWASVLWVLSAIYLTWIGNKHFQLTPDYKGGESYLVFYLLYIFVVVLLQKLGKVKDLQLPLSVFFLGSVTLFFSDPLYENDHFRYLWEGGIFLKGYNPYLYPPEAKELAHLPFEFKHQIGFSYLTTVYPPLALVWFGLGGVFGFTAGLKILMFLNTVLVWLTLKILRPWVKPWLLILLFPCFQKEFIQAIHIDLLAALPFLYLLTNWNNLGHGKKILLIATSYWTKVISAVAFSFVALEKKFKSFSLSILSIASLPMILLVIVGSWDKLTGLKAFSANWVWNPGFWSFSNRVLGIGEEYSRRLCLVLFCVYLVILLSYWFFIGLKKNFVYRRVEILVASYLIYSGLMFFTPVYNAWYAVWFAFPAALLNLRTGVLYAAFSFLCYTHYYNPELHPVAEFLTHVWYVISLGELWLTRTYRESLA